jgi:hypothetical protein
MRLSRRLTRRRTERTIAVLSALTAVNAVGGSLYGVWGAPKIPREWLEGSPFNDYKIPSVFLGIAVGGSSAMSAGTAWRGNEHAALAAVAAGGILTAWVAAQVAMIGLRSPLQPLFGGVGIAMVAFGLDLRCDAEDDYQSSAMNSGTHPAIAASRH